MPRGKSQRSLDLIAGAHRILGEIQPASVRAVCYRLFTERLIGSMKRNETNRVSRLLTEARESGTLPWAWIVDETREPECVATWRDPAAYIRATRNDYRRDHWTLQPRRVEVWSEKGTVRGTLAPVLEEYAVTFRVLHGYASATTVRAAVEDCLDGGKPVLALYVGDWDPSGLHMTEVDLSRRLTEYHRNLCAERDLNPATAPTIELARIALVASDVGRGTRLPSFPAATKRGDTRWRWYTRRYGARCWEVDALNPRELRDRVAAAIGGAIRWPTWRRSQRAEAAETASLQTVLDNWNVRAS
jgi:hypothetical protein